MCPAGSRSQKNEDTGTALLHARWAAAFRFELTGDLDDEGARRLERDWRTASSVTGDRLLIVDMTFVTSAGNEACNLLARWHASGARLIANTQTSRSLVQSILGTAKGAARRRKSQIAPDSSRRCAPDGDGRFPD